METEITAAIYDIKFNTNGNKVGHFIIADVAKIVLAKSKRKRVELGYNSPPNGPVLEWANKNNYKIIYSEWSLSGNEINFKLVPK